MDRVVAALIQLLEFEKRYYRTEMGIENSSLSSFEDFQAELRDCRKCALYETATQKVFGYGNTDAEIMIVGEAPGADEDRMGKPFVGKAGQKLTQMLSFIGIDREDVYISNLLKCRPPNNADPVPDQINACRGFLEREIEMVNPSVILTLGRFSSNIITGQNLTMGKLSGNIYDYKGITVVPTYHPSSLLFSKGERLQTIRVRIAEDLNRLKIILGRTS